MPMKWKGAEAMRLIRMSAAQRLSGAGMFIRGEARKNISESQSTVLRHHAPAEGEKKGASYRVGLDPSAPGEFPKKVSGFLRRGVAYEVDTDRLEARIGTNVPYGKHLEFGTANMEARPWLLKTILENVGTLKQKFGIGRQI